MSAQGIAQDIRACWNEQSLTVCIVCLPRCLLRPAAEGSGCGCDLAWSHGQHSKLTVGLSLAQQHALNAVERCLSTLGAAQQMQQQLQLHAAREGRHVGAAV